MIFSLQVFSIGHPNLPPQSCQAAHQLIQVARENQVLLPPCLFPPNQNVKLGLSFEQTKSIPPRIRQRHIPRRARHVTDRKCRNSRRIPHASDFRDNSPEASWILTQRSIRRQSSGKPIAAMAAIFPTHGPFSHQITVAKTVLLALESFASAVLAFAYAAVQSRSPGATSTGMAKARRERLVTSR